LTLFLLSSDTARVERRRSSSGVDSLHRTVTSGIREAREILMRKRKTRRATLFVAVALALGGTAAFAAEGNRGYSGPNAPNFPPVSRPAGQVEPTLPPEAKAEYDRMQAEIRRTGKRPPAPEWDDKTGGLKRNPDGSVKLVEDRCTPQHGCER
jgi:hypothetical protein